MTPRPIVALEAAETYFASRLRSDVWDSASSGEKSKSLAQASFLIAGAFEFGSDAFSLGDDGAVVWNERVVAAVCEEALWLLRRDPTDIPDFLTLGLASASAGGASASFDKTAIAPLVCRAAKTLIGEFGDFVATDDGAGTIRSTPLAL